MNAEHERTRNHERPIEPRNWLWVATSVAVAIILGLGTLHSLRLFARPLAFLILAVSIAAALNPLARTMERWMPRSIATVILFLVILAVLVVLGLLVVPPLVPQVTDFANSLPELAERARGWINQWDTVSADQIVGRLSDQLGSIGSRLVQVPITLSTSLVEFFLIVFMSLYLVILTPGIRQFFLSLFPEGRRERVGQVASHVVGAMGGYVRGSLISGLIIGVITYFGLLLIGVEFPLVLAIIAGLFELLPIIGPYMSGAIMTAVALLGGVTQALITLGFVLLLQQVESNLIIPNVMSAEAEISPLMTILAITAGAGVGGIIGALVAVPIAAALHVLVVEVVAPAMRRQTGAEPWVSPVEEVKGDER